MRRPPPLDQLDAAVQAARRAAAGWRALDVAERVAALNAAATTAAGQLAASDAAQLYTREHGKVLAEARFEIDTAPALPAILGAIAEQALAPERIDPQSAYPRLQREPYGVAALVLPFNWPLALTMTKLSSALAAGNTAVVKVPPTCPLAALQFGAAFAAALPPGVVNVLAGPGQRTGPGTDHPPRRRRHLADRRRGHRTRRDGGGGAAADPGAAGTRRQRSGDHRSRMCVTDELVEQLFTATYTTCGQVCMAIKRLYAPADTGRRAGRCRAGALPT